MQNNQTGTAKQVGNKMGEAASKISEELKSSGYSGLSDTVDRVGEKLGAVRDKLVDQAENSFEELTDASKRIYKEGATALQKIENFVKERPVLASAIALGLGVLVTTFLSNRKDKQG